MRELWDMLQTPTVGGPLWLWLVLGVIVGGALFGVGSGDYDGCPALAARC